MSKKTLMLRGPVLLAVAVAPDVASGAVGEHEGTFVRADFNGDGELDIVVSSPQDDCGRGVIHIRSGSSVNSWTRSTGGVLGNSACYQYFGTALATGDFDNDGYDDLAVSAPGASDTGDARSGAVHVFYGGNSGLSTIGDQLWTQDTTGIQNVAEPYDYLGDTLEVGDFNCDGYDDLVIGVPREDLSAGSNAGAVHVLYGSAGGVSTVDDWWHQGVTGVNGAVEANDNFGGALAAGNFNGDDSGVHACDDLAIASPGESVGSIARAGFVYIMDGGASGLSTSSDQAFHQNSAGVAGVAEAYDEYGVRLEVVDDNGDQFDDLMLSVPGDACVPGKGEGQHVMRGGTGGLRVTDDELECSTFRCWIDGASYTCPAHGPPVRGQSLGEDFAMLVTDDVVWAGNGDDSVSADQGDDIVFAGRDDDLIRGGAGSDLLIGGPGDDTFEIGLDCEAVPGEVIDGGPGTDTVLSHLSRTRLEALGVQFRSIEAFVYRPEDPEGDCVSKPYKVHTSDIASVTLDQTFYEKTDEVVLDIATNRTGFTASADFGVVDTSYSVGDETLVGSGTQALQLRYALSGNSTVKAGNYRLPIEIRDAAGRLVHRFGIAIKYAPSGVPGLVPQGGVFQLAARPARADSGWRVQGAQFVANTPVEPPDPQLDFSTTVTPPVLTDHTLQVTFRAPQAASIGQFVQLELGEKDRDGTFSVLGEVEPGCSPVSGTSDCDYVVGVGIDGATGDHTLQPLDIRVMDSVGGVSPSTEFPLVTDAADPEIATVRGRVQVRYQRQVPDIVNPDDYQVGIVSFEETFPLPEGTLVRVDFCGQTRTGPVDIFGRFTLNMLTNCLHEDDGFIEVFSVSEGSAANRVAVGSWVGTSSISAAETLTNDPDDYKAYAVTIADGLEVDDARASGGLDIGTFVIDEDDYPGPVGAFVGMRGVVDAIKYADGLQGVDLHDLPSVNILAEPELCLSSGSLSCNSFGGETRTGIHPGFFYVQDWNFTREGVYAHEWGHVFHLRMLRAQRYNEFGEAYANMIAQSALNFAGRADDGWLLPLGGAGAENMDFNGKSNPSGGQTEQVVMRPFFATTTEAAAVAGDYGCDEPDDDGNPPSMQSMGNCVMRQSQGAAWRVYWDLHDGADAEPVSVFVDSEGSVTSLSSNFEQVDGGGGIETVPAVHSFHNMLVAYVGSSDAGGSHPNYVDRGQTNLDLVDVLDGMVCRGHMTEQEGRDLLRDAHKYDYDFLPVNATCN